MIYNKDGDELLTTEEIENLLPPIDEPHELFLQVFDKITGIGDSLMAGYTLLSNNTVISSETAKERGANWLTYLGADIGRQPNNLAVGNTSTHDWRYGGNNADITAADIQTNCYLIGLGVNDSRRAETVGTSEDIKANMANNADSYYGNMDWIVRTLHAYNANAHIFLFTIPGPENSTRKPAINAAIKHIAGLYDYVHCIDLDGKYAQYFNGESFISTNYFGGHYDPIAYRLIASYIGRALNEYIYENYTLFRNVPYLA